MGKRAIETTGGFWILLENMQAKVEDKTNRLL
jgi:hypothetical protein